MCEREKEKRQKERERTNVHPRNLTRKGKERNKKGGVTMVCSKEEKMVRGLEWMCDMCVLICKVIKCKSFQVQAPIFLSVRTNTVPVWLERSEA